MSANDPRARRYGETSEQWGKRMLDAAIADTRAKIEACFTGDKIAAAIRNP